MCNIETIRNVLELHSDHPVCPKPDREKALAALSKLDQEHAALVEERDRLRESARLDREAMVGAHERLKVSLRSGDAAFVAACQLLRSRLAATPPAPAEATPAQNETPCNMHRHGDAWYVGWKCSETCSSGLWRLSAAPTSAPSEAQEARGSAPQPCTGVGTLSTSFQQGAASFSELPTHGTCGICGQTVAVDGYQCCKVHPYKLAAVVAPSAPPPPLPEASKPVIDLGGASYDHGSTYARLEDDGSLYLSFSDGSHTLSPSEVAGLARLLPLPPEVAAVLRAAVEQTKAEEARLAARANTTAEQIALNVWYTTTDATESAVRALPAALLASLGATFLLLAAEESTAEGA